MPRKAISRGHHDNAHLCDIALWLDSIVFFINSSTIRIDITSEYAFAAFAIHILQGLMKPAYSAKQIYKLASHLWFMLMVIIINILSVFCYIRKVPYIVRKSVIERKKERMLVAISLKQDT
jgi:hypothetical protein